MRRGLIALLAQLGTNNRASASHVALRLQHQRIHEELNSSPTLTQSSGPPIPTLLPQRKRTAGGRLESFHRRRKPGSLRSSTCIRASLSLATASAGAGLQLELCCFVRPRTPGCGRRRCYWTSRLWWTGVDLQTTSSPQMDPETARGQAATPASAPPIG